MAYGDIKPILLEAIQGGQEREQVKTKDQIEVVIDGIQHPGIPVGRWAIVIVPIEVVLPTGQSVHAIHPKMPEFALAHQSGCLLVSGGTAVELMDLANALPNPETESAPVALAAFAAAFGSQSPLDDIEPFSTDRQLAQGDQALFQRLLAIEKLNRIVPRLSSADQELLQRLLAKQTQAHIAEAIGLQQSTVSQRRTRLIARIRFWLNRPEAPPDDELVVRLVHDIGLDERVASLAVAYAAGASTADLTRLPAGKGLSQPAAWDRVRRLVPRALARSEHPTARLMSSLLDHRRENWPRSR